MTADGEDKTPVMMLVSVVLWVSTFAAILIGIRLRIRPIMFVGMVDGLLALFVTILAVTGRGRR